MTPPADGLRAKPSIPTHSNELIVRDSSKDPSTLNKTNAANSTQDENGAWQLIPDVRLRMNFGANGERDGQLFNDKFGAIGDFRNQGAAISLLTNVNGGPVRFNFGGTVRWDYQKGNLITFGSAYHHWMIGPSVEADFRPAWSKLTGPNWSPLAYVGANYGIGYGSGQGTHNDGLNYDHGGLAMGLSLYVNVLNFSIGKVQICVDFDYTNTLIDGPDGNDNWPVSHGFGFSIAARPSVKPMIKKVEVPVCADDRERVPELAAEVAKLKAENETQLAKVDGLKYYLENLPKNPFKDAQIQKALLLGYVAEALKQKFGGKNISTENLGKIQRAITAAGKAKEGDEALTILNITGLDKGTVADIYSGAKIKLSQTRGFWSLPEDPVIDEKALAQISTPEQSDDEPCGDVEKNRTVLENWRMQLHRRNAALEQQYRRALHLAGLVLGEEVIEQVGTVFNATFLRVDTPNFVTARPNSKHLKALEAAAKSKSPQNPGTVAEFLKISRRSGKKRVFLLAKEEAEKLKNLADWMNGKAELQGEERHRKFLADQGLEKTTPPAKRKNKIEKAYQDWIKSLKIMVVGHTDSRGGDGYNLKLSKNRANYIRQALLFFGVAGDRVQSFGAGEKYPIVPEKRQKGKARTAARLKNRRVEFIPITGDPYSTGMDRNKLRGEHHDASKGDHGKKGVKLPDKPMKKVEPVELKKAPPVKPPKK